jgi:hypothetical protein
MDGVWLTYRELAEKLGSSAEGARRRAQRGRWTRQRGNDGLARVMVPNDALDAPRPVRTPSAQGDGRPDADPAHFAADSKIAALEAYVATLKAQLAAADARANEEAARTAQGIAALEDHNATLKADVERLEAQFAAGGRDLAAERERTDRAIEVFSVLAKRLDALAAQRAKPWWRRLAG